MAKKTLLCVVGARPNFMKIAPIIRELQACSERATAYLVHTGQHYDHSMKAAFFEQLGIPEPDVDLGVGSGSHAEQTANIMLRFEPVLDAVKPCAVLVVGDVNSTIACGLVAVKKHIPLIHVESGLRSGDRTMPEEINRVLTDQISDCLFTTERTAAANLAREGIAAARVHFVGNVMIDTLRDHLQHAIPAASTLALHGLSLPVADGGYALVTLHRPANVDDPAVLRGLLQVLRQISDTIPVVFPVHPRTSQRIDEFGLASLLADAAILRLPPVAYLNMLGLMRAATMVLTDSGGVQEETTALGVPCLTLRDNTERPITVDHGTNTIVGADPVRIAACVADILATGGKAGRVPEHWDGQAARRIVRIIDDLYLQ